MVLLFSYSNYIFKIIHFKQEQLETMIVSIQQLFHEKHIILEFNYFDYTS